MTTRITALTVYLDGDPRDDDVAALIAAIRQLRGVSHVDPVENTIGHQIAKREAEIDVMRRVYAALEAIASSVPPR